MNQFLEYLFIKANEEKDILEELIIIDNKVQLTDFRLEELIIFIKNNINYEKFINLSLINKTDIITEGYPITTLKVLNDFPSLLNSLYINRAFLGINNWLIQKAVEFYNKSIILDEESYYYQYANSDNDILVIGYQEFIESVLDDLNMNLMTYVIN